jgi:hypothetical protein
MPQLRINTDAVVAFTNKLEKLPRTAFPVAVRAALNSAAFDMKKNTLPKSAKDNFVQRKPSFFKANSRVEMAKGFDINRMQSVVGFTGKDQAIDDLEQQEFGGKIGSRSFIPWKNARTSNNWNKSVRPINRLSSIPLDKVINAERVRFKGHDRNQKQKFVRAAIMAKKLHGNNAYVLTNKYGDGRQTLMKIDEIWESSRHGNHPIEIRRTPIYSFKKGRNVKVKGKQFAKRAANEAHIKISDHYIKAAEFQFKKALQ